MLFLQQKEAGVRELYSKLGGTELFAGLNEEDFVRALRSMHARRRTFAGGEALLLAGDIARWMGIVLAGEVRIAVPGYDGDEYTVGRIGPGGMFAESFVCAGVRHMPVDVLAASEGEALLLEYRPDFVHSDDAALRRVVANLVAALAGKNVYLNGRLNIVTRKTTRQKLLAYLAVEARQQNTRRVRLAFGRQQLADMLGVERSAMSAEMSRMARDGLIAYDRHTVELL